MSDTATCEKCGRSGRRRLFKAAPDSWFYLEVKDEKGAEYIIHFCSRVCYASALQGGPSNLSPSECGQTL